MTRALGAFVVDLVKAVEDRVLGRGHDGDAVRAPRRAARRDGRALDQRTISGAFALNGQLVPIARAVDRGGIARAWQLDPSLGGLHGLAELPQALAP